MLGQKPGVPHGPGDVGLTQVEAKTHFGICERTVPNMFRLLLFFFMLALPTGTDIVVPKSPLQGA